MGTQMYNSGGHITDWHAVGGAALQGGITGGVAGATGGASLVVTVIASATANAVGGTLNRTVQGKQTTAGDIAVDAATGGGFGAAGHIVGKVVTGGLNKLSNSAKGKLGEAITEVRYASKGYRSLGKAEVPTGGRTPTGRVQVAKYDHAMENVFTGRRLTVESKFNGGVLTTNQRNAIGNITTPGGLIIDRSSAQQIGQAAKSTITGSAGQIRRE